MNRTILIFIFVVVLKSIQGQTGRLNLNTEIALKKTEYYNFFLYKSDSLVRSTRLSNVGHWKIDSLHKGSYKLSVKEIDGTDIINQSDILIYEDSITYEDIIIGESISPITDSSNSIDFQEINCALLYGNNKYFENQRTISNNQIYTLRIGSSLQFTSSKFNKLCAYIGISGTGTVFNKDTLKYKEISIDKKRYLGLCVDLGLYNRFTFYNCKNPRKYGIFFDSGINYSLPLYYRETKVIDYQTKIKTKFIHTYTDVYAMARLGVKWLAITGEYNLTTFLKKPYTATPTVRIGITFCSSH